MIVRVRPDRVPDACPEALMLVIMSVLVPGLVIVVVTGLVAVVMAGLVAVVMAGLVTGLAAVAGLVLVAVLAAHDPSMTRKTRCSISTPASRTRLRTARSCA